MKLLTIDLKTYIRQVTHLNHAPGPVWTDSTRKRAPHKPLLLLCLLELAEEGAMSQEIMPANPAHWPARHHLEWHRKHRFLGG